MNYPFYNPNALPQQHVLQISGKESIAQMQMPPNSSLIAMDSSAPMVWLCVSDGVGKITATPYDITPHIDKQPPSPLEAFEERFTKLEQTIERLEAKLNEQSHDANADQ